MLLQWKGAQGGGCAIAGRRDGRNKEDRVGWVENVVGAGEVGVGGWVWQVGYIGGRGCGD